MVNKLNHLDIYRFLNRSNCRECGMPTCMAFALSVINGDIDLDACPHIDAETSRELDRKIIRKDRDKEREDLMGPLKNGISSVDFHSAAEGLGAEPVGERLRIKCLGKDFIIDREGNAESVCHINSWVMMPLLKYINTGGKGSLSGTWKAFEELEKGPTMSRYFSWRCEEPLRRLADAHTDILFDLLNIFGAEEQEGFSADYARTIYPLPKVPFLILYWKQEGHFESKLKICVDGNTNKFLDTHSVYVLARGIVEMLKRIISSHDELLPSLLAL